MTKTNTDLCSVCDKRALSSQKGIYCNVFQLWQHLKCSLLNITEYSRNTQLDDDDCYCALVSEEFISI